MSERQCTIRKEKLSMRKRAHDIMFSESVCSCVFSLLHVSTSHTSFQGNGKETSGPNNHFSMILGRCVAGCSLSQLMVNIGFTFLSPCTWSDNLSILSEQCTTKRASTRSQTTAFLSTIQLSLAKVEDTVEITKTHTSQASSLGQSLGRFVLNVLVVK